MSNVKSGGRLRVVAKSASNLIDFVSKVFSGEHTFTVQGPDFRCSLEVGKNTWISTNYVTARNEEKHIKCGFYRCFTFSLLIS